MKRVIALVIGSCLCFGMLVGCGNAEESKTVSSALSSSASGVKITEEQSEVALDVLQQIKDYGIDINHYVLYDNATDPNGNQDWYEAKLNFADSNHEPNSHSDEPLSGSIEVFESPNRAIERADYLNDKSIHFNDFGYQIIKDNILLRLNTLFSDSYAQEYAKAIGGELYTVPNEKELKYANKTAENTVHWKNNWQSVALSQFPDAEVNVDDAFVEIKITSDNQDYKDIVSKCFTVCMHLSDDNISDGTVVHVYLDDQMALVASRLSGRNSFDFVTTNMLTDNAEFSEAYQKLFILTDINMINYEESLRQQKQQIQNEIDAILGN